MTDIARPERITVPGDVDFTMMYAAHDAFARHLQWVIAAVEAGRARDAGTHARWDLFAHQLHVHHTAEDELLWPALEASIDRPEGLLVLEAMEQEHAVIDPLLEQIAAAYVSGTDAELQDSLHRLQEGLLLHMRHEENEALPLIATHLGRAGWARFGAGIRKMQGVSGAAVYLPWLLDGALPATSAKVLKVLPAPARLIYRLRWLPKYRRGLR